MGIKTQCISFDAEKKQATSVYCKPAVVLTIKFDNISNLEKFNSELSENLYTEREDFDAINSIKKIKELIRDKTTTIGENPKHHVTIPIADETTYKRFTEKGCEDEEMWSSILDRIESCIREQASKEYWAGRE